eukprot:8251576-Ditylum_brightwellii.AAC.1
MWFICKRNWHSNAGNEGIKYLMESSYTVPPDGTKARELYKSENWHFYYVLLNCVKGGQGLIHIRKHELTLDGRESFCEIMDFMRGKKISP